MKNLLRLTIAALMLFMLGETAEAVTVKGSRTCSQWQRAREDQDMSMLAARNWLLGYLSGLSTGRDREFWGGGGTRVAELDNDSVFVWVDNYCAAHAKANLGEAGEALFLERMQEVQKGK
jgi:hypothetical protein